ncbi:hypothetical protein ABK040_011424 [Willaertia magna]
MVSFSTKILQYIDKKDNEKNDDDDEYQTLNEYNIYHIGKNYNEFNIEKTKTIIERPFDEFFRDEFSAILKRQGSYTFTNEVIGIHLHSVGDNNRTSTTTITNANEGNYACSVFSWFEMYYQLVYFKHKDLFSEELQMKIEKEKIFYDSIMKSTFKGIGM